MKSKLNLSNYLNENCFQGIASNAVYEAFRNTDVDRAIQLMGTFLKKRGVFTIPCIEQGNVGGDATFMVFAFTKNNKGCAFVWDRGESSTIRSILFTSDFDKAYASYNAGVSNAWDIELTLKGANVVRCLQLVADVMNGRVGMDVTSMNKVIRDAQVWESADEELVGVNMINEDNDNVIANLQRKYNNLSAKLYYQKSKGKDVSALQQELEQVKAELKDARASVKANVPVVAAADKDLERVESRFEDKERALPEERFGDMEHYIIQVIKGFDPLCLVTGAPGLGKTYRIMKAVDKEGLVRGDDYIVIKGKCTPMALYMTIHDYQNEGQLIIIDDADDIIKDDTCINLIKAATDSSDERIVSYGSSAAPLAPEEKLGLYDDFEMDGHGRWRYPRDFVYSGNMIIITNMRAGQIDTAIRSRAVICDLDFTNEEILGLIESIAPHIMPGKLTEESKARAMNYLRELVEQKVPMKLAIRTFTTVAKQYMSNADENTIQRRVREQMKMQALQGGKKY